jgi:subtilisin family serine protease
MPRQARRAKRLAFRLEVLEPRALLSGTPYGPQPSVVEAVASPSSELFVRFAATAPAALTQAELDAVGAQLIRSFPDGPDLVALAPGADRSAALVTLKAESDVLYAEADGTIQAAAVYPNDPYFPLQWGLNNTSDVDIDAPQAWSVTTGNPATIVAVLDTGIDLTNSDLAGKVWVNPNASGSDGYPGDVLGWNFVSNTSNVQDNNGHGSNVAGILAGACNNGIGITGVNWNARLMDVKVLDAAGNGTTVAAVSGIYYAVQHGARVINASWGGSEYSQAMVDAINYANANNVVFVTAAGNNSANNDVVPTYPASYRLPNELVVAAVDQYGNLASYSNYGPTTVDLAAPGSNIWSTVVGGYAYYTGTSMATPYVSGVVSLVEGLHPNLTAAELVYLVRATTKPLPSLVGKTISGGMVDAAQALGLPGSGQDGGGIYQIPVVVVPPVSKVALKAKAKKQPKPKPKPKPKHVVVHKTAHPRVAALQAKPAHDGIALDGVRVSPIVRVRYE